MLNIFKWLFTFYKRFPFVMGILIICTPLVASISMIHPIFLRYYGDAIDQTDEKISVIQRLVTSVIDYVFIDIRYLTVAGWALFGLSILLTYSFLQGSRAWMNLRLEWEFRQQAFNATTSKGPDFFNKFRTGDLITRMTDDVQEKLSWFACSGIFRFYEAILLIFFAVVMMLTMHSLLTVLVFLPLPILIVIFMKAASSLDQRFEKLQKKISDLNGVIEACFSGVRVVKAFSREEMWKNKFAKTIDERRQAEIRAVKSWALIESLWMYVWQLGFVILLVAGGYLAIYSDLTFGEFWAFEFYLTTLIYKMFDIGQFLVKSRQSAVSIGRVREIEDFAEMVVNGRPEVPEISFEQIRFDKVAFKFKNGNRYLIDEIDFTIPKGETVALVGKVGSGKSWVINMLARLADPTTGDVYLDKQTLREIPLDSYRNLIGYVPQEPILFSGTIEENIRFGHDGVDDEKISSVVQLSQLESLVSNATDGLQTKIGTRGINISGGEKQRLSIARALVRNPSILILDDCTSALDAATEEKLWEQLQRVMPDMTCFVVTHRTKTLQQVDRIFVFDEGKITGSGKHKELLENNSIYHELYSRSELAEQVGEDTE